MYNPGDNLQAGARQKRTTDSKYNEIYEGTARLKLLKTRLQQTYSKIRANLQQ